ncbi:MAG: hypothetical protein ABSE84_07930 [Isosphaeraceae bacterium]|jgi:hypothetical protein
MLHPESLKLIQTAACDAQKAEIIPLPGDGRKALVRIGTTVQEHAIAPPCRQHAVETVEALASYARKLTTPAAAVVWHDGQEITLVLDDADRRDFVKLSLKPAPQFQAAQGLSAMAAPISQEELIALLRHKLGAPKDLVSVFRSVDFQRTDGAQANLQHGKNTLGKQVNAQLVGADRVPEEITLTIPVFTNCGLNTPYPLKLNVDVDVVRCQFRLVVVPGGLDDLMDRAQEAIAKSLTTLLKDSGIPIYRGSFSA